MNKGFVEDNIKLNNPSIWNEFVNSDSGIVFSFYHWGLFQLVVPVLLEKFNKPVVLFAGEEAVFYQKEIVNVFFPAHKDKFIPLPVTNMSIRKAISHLKEGAIVCILPELSSLDPNIKNLTTKEFLGLDIITPHGVSAMSYFSKTPIFRAILNIDPEHNLEMDIKVICDSFVKSKNDFQKYTNEIWDDLELLCENNPIQWGGWEILDRIQGVKVFA
jgi:lauroyl/myristoyl acyltransferase